MYSLLGGNYILIIWSKNISCLLNITRKLLLKIYINYKELYKKYWSGKFPACFHMDFEPQTVLSIHTITEQKIHLKKTRLSQIN